MLVEFAVPYPGDLEAPEGFEKVSWDSIHPGDEVYLACLSQESPKIVAKGPFKVLMKFWLQGENLLIQEPGERILRKQEKTIE